MVGDNDGARATSISEVGDTSSSQGLLQEARSKWLGATCAQDLHEAEHIYREIIRRETTNGLSSSTNEQDVSEPESKRSKTHPESEENGKTLEDSCASSTCVTSPSLVAKEKLAMLLLQSCRAPEADILLESMGYTCRLAEQVLNYPTDTTTSQQHHQIDARSTNQSTSRLLDDPPCRIWDNFLTDQDLQVLSQVFANPQSTYWTDHDYSVEPPSPYFSYVIPLKQHSSQNEDAGDDTTALMRDFGFLGNLIHRMRDALSREWKPNLVQSCTHVELWAHNRPPATGHQLHFDSDNEGQGKVVRHPICSTILYLSDFNLGGPSLITNQRRISRSLADKGWLCTPRWKRLTAFDGRVLHGVIPGKGFVSNGMNEELKSSHPTHQSTGRRVTLMMAFWRRLEVRDHGLSKVGAAKEFPKDREWAKILRQQNYKPTFDSSEPAPAKPVKLDHVYETVGNKQEAKPWLARMGMPAYDEIYQGF